MAPSRALHPLRGICTTCARQQLQMRRFSVTANVRYAEESSLPRIATTSFWASLIPKPFRRPSDPVEAAERAKIKAARSKEWNPATIFIILGVLVGSNAIQIIALRNDMLNFSRKTDAKLALLREVVEKVKNGEEVDVKRVLGTGDPEAEKEWEDVVRELESTDMLLEGRKKREAKRLEREDRRNLEEKEKLTARQREGSWKAQESGTKESVTDESATARRPRFVL